MSRRESAKRFPSSAADERRLIEAAQGDISQFAELYESYFEIVYAFVVRRVRDRAETEDLTSEVFHRALRSLPRFKWTGAPFATWLFRIASNLIADRARHKGRDTMTAVDSVSSNDRDGLETLEGRSTTFNNPANAIRTNAMQDEIEHAEERAHLLRLVNDLSDDQRTVLMMRFSEERSIRKIAHELGRTEGAIKQLQLRALKNLRAMLAGEVESEFSDGD